MSPRCIWEHDRNNVIEKKEISSLAVNSYTKHGNATFKGQEYTVTKTIASRNRRK